MDGGAKAPRAAAKRLPRVSAAYSLFTVLCRHLRRDTPASREVPDDHHPAWRTRRDQIVEDLVGRRLVEDALVAIGEEVVLQCLELETTLIGNVANSNRAKVGQARLRAHRRELGAVDGDLEVALRSRVRKRLERVLGRHWLILTTRNRTGREVRQLVAAFNSELLWLGGLLACSPDVVTLV